MAPLHFMKLSDIESQGEEVLYQWFIIAWQVWTPKISCNMCNKWESDCNTSLSSDDCEYCIYLCKCTRSLTVGESAIKLFTRWYFTPTKLHFIFPSVSPAYFRGCSFPDSFPHIFWDCEKISHIWRKLEAFSAIITVNPIHLTLANCLLFASIPQISLICDLFIPFVFIYTGL